MIHKVRGCSLNKKRRVILIKNILQVSFYQSSAVHCKLCEKQENVPVSTFKKRPFPNDFTIESKTEKVISALRKYCSSTSNNDLMQEAKYRNLKGSVLKSVNFTVTYEKVTYVHQGSFTGHVDINTSLHNWCKEKVTGETQFRLIMLIKKDHHCAVERNRNDFMTLLYQIHENLLTSPLE